MPQGLQQCWDGKESEPYKMGKNFMQKIAWMKNFCIDEDRSVLMILCPAVRSGCAAIMNFKN